MLPTFVIGLREGLEAALIVGIIAAFLNKQGRGDLLRWLFAGVLVAVLLCAGVGVALDIVSRDLPQRQQEGLETVIGILAVGMVTYMVVWMRRHSRELKGQLEGLAADAISTPGGSAARAMVVMAFLAVMREGFETVVFLLAAFNESDNRASAGTGALLGILLAVGLGYGIYRGGVRINLSRFFRATGLVLVFVAAGLVVSALHTGHEAGWFTFGQTQTIDLTSVPIIGWLLRAGSVQASLLTGMLGIQPRPVLIEVVGWLVYLVPVGAYVAWPPGRPVPHRALARGLAAFGAAAAAAALVLVVTAPSGVDYSPVTEAGAVNAQMVSAAKADPVVHTQIQSPADTAHPITQPATDIRVQSGGLDRHAGLVTELLTATEVGTAAKSLPATMSLQQITALDGGRLPLGVRATGVSELPVRYQDETKLEVWTMPATGRIVDMRWTETVKVQVVAPGIGAVPIDAPLRTAASGLPSASAATAQTAARSDQAAVKSHADRTAGAWLLLTLAVLALAGAGLLAMAGRRTSEQEVPELPLARIPSPV